METISLKSLAIKVLQGNAHGNQMETVSFQAGNFQETCEINRKLFEALFHEHSEKLRHYALTDAEIKRQRPDLHKQIQSAINVMDSSWIKWDLQGFKQAINKIEAVYLKALQEITEW